MELNNSIKETCSYQNSSESQEPFFSSQTTSSNNKQLKLQTLQLRWQDQQQKLGNLLPPNADLYQIMQLRSCDRITLSVLMLSSLRPVS